MKTKVIATIMTMLFLASITIFAIPMKADPAVLHVDDDGVQWPGAYTTISAALAVASSGDTIIVHEGTYTEQVDVNIDVTITAAVGEERPVVNADPKAFVITADDATVEGFKTYQKLTAFGTGNDVIMVYDADHVTVRNNIVKGAGPYTTWQDRNPGPGITVLISDDVTIEGNRIYDTSGAGIWFGSSINSEIKDNTIVDSQYTGILLPNWIGMGPSHDNLIKGNKVRSAGNPDMVWDDGIRLGAGAYDNTVEYNRVSGSIRHGIRAVGTTSGNIIQYNKIRGSGTGPTGGFDAYDQTSPLANTWTGNSGRTSSPDGLVSMP